MAQPPESANDDPSGVSPYVSAEAWTRPAVVLATGFWLGRSSVAPGTFGALLGLPLAWAVSLVPMTWLQVVVIIAIAGASIPVCTVAARRLGGSKDPGAIVLDEIASLPITFFLVPHETMNRPLVLIAGFALHRLFDITKPTPAAQLERLPEGLGIMADDWAAAVYSCLALHAVLWLGWI